MWIEFQLCCLNSETRECLVNSDHIVGLTYFMTENEEPLFKISFLDEADEFMFSCLETAIAVYMAFKDALNGYSATIDGIGYVKPLSSSRYEKGTLCAPAEVIDWHKMP